MTAPKWYSMTMPRGIMLKDGTPNPWYGLTAEEIGKELDAVGADRWVIGEEVGESGYEHWQIKVVFKKGKKKESLYETFPYVNIQPATTFNFEYEEKEGRFLRSWERSLAKFVHVNLYDWQSELLNKIAEMNGDDRHIILLMDEKGNAGKTFLSKHLVAIHQGAYCPPLPEALDYMAWALAHKTAKTFIIDLPRAESFSDAKKEAQLWSAIEQMKNGYLYDKRHEWKEAWIEPPNIVVIGNFEPRWSMLSADRWITGIMKGGKDQSKKWIEWQ
nr:MAG: replication associated protein [ssDNA virus sp.]